MHCHFLILLMLPASIFAQNTKQRIISDRINQFEISSTKGISKLEVNDTSGKLLYDIEGKLRIKIRDLNKDGRNELIFRRLWSEESINHDDLLIIMFNAKADTIFERNGFKFTHFEQVAPGDLIEKTYLVYYKIRDYNGFPLLKVKEIKTFYKPKSCACDSGKEYRLKTSIVGFNKYGKYSVMDFNLITPVF